LIFLILSVILSSYLTLSFKVIERFRISTFQSIVFNYISCVITGSLLEGSWPLQSGLLKEPWLPWAGIMGFAFIFLFNIIGFTAQKLGVAIASVATKLSLVIPVLFSVYLYQETLSAVQIGGILMALAAVVLTSWPASGRGVRTFQEPVLQASGNYSRRSFSKSGWLFLTPVVLFVGSGMLDTLIKYVEQGYLDETNKNLFLITAFGVAALIGGLFLMLQLITGKEKFDFRSVLAGILIGVPNYFSIWCLVQVLKTYGNRSASIIPVNNMSIVLFSSVMAWLLFREQLSRRNWAGIVLAIAAIAAIAYG
jgi:drug/metabolite transporter (DMT)-like permease